MKTYFIRTYRKEESDKVMAVLATHESMEITKKSGIMCYETIDFKCKKGEWKKIKKELNLKVESVFSKMKVV